MIFGFVFLGFDVVFCSYAIRAQRGQFFSRSQAPRGNAALPALRGFDYRISHVSRKMCALRDAARHTLHYHAARGNEQTSKERATHIIEGMARSYPAELFSVLIGIGMRSNMTQQHYLAALALFDKANGEDPNKEVSEGKEYPKELLYALRMTEMQERYVPEASEAVKLAVRAQHIQRWTTPRSNYSMDRQGYLQWRTGLYKFHAELAGALMKEAGYDDAMIERVRAIISKKGLKVNPETQLMEDVADLVFIEHYMVRFATSHPEYDEEKWLQIIRKTWQKMSDQAHEFALAGKIKLPEALVPLILTAVKQ